MKQDSMLKNFELKKALMNLHGHRAERHFPLVEVPGRNSEKTEARVTVCDLLSLTGAVLH